MDKKVLFNQNVQKFDSKADGQSIQVLITLVADLKETEDDLRCCQMMDATLRNFITNNEIEEELKKELEFLSSFIHLELKRREDVQKISEGIKKELKQNYFDNIKEKIITINKLLKDEKPKNKISNV